MITFAIIGFVLVLLLGVFLFFVGIAIGIVSEGLSGVHSNLWMIASALGLSLVYLALTNAPFTINFEVTP